MTSLCSTCRSSDVHAVNIALLEGDSYASVARRFGIPKDSVRRHARGHLQRFVTVPEVAERLELGRELFDTLKASVRYFAERLASARKYQRRKEARILLRQYAGLLALYGKLITKP